MCLLEALWKINENIRKNILNLFFELFSGDGKCFFFQYRIIYSLLKGKKEINPDRDEKVQISMPSLIKI